MTDINKRLVERHILLMFFFLYIISAKGYIEVADTLFSVQTAESIVSNGRLDIPFEANSTLKGVGGLSYSKYGIGLALYYIPIVLTANYVSWATGLPTTHLTGFLISFANIPFALLTLHLFGKTLQLLEISWKISRLLVIALGSATLCWKYAVYDFSEAMQASLLLLSYNCVLVDTKRSILLGGLGLGGLILVKLVHVVFLPVFLLYILFPKNNKNDSWKHKIYNSILYVLPTLPILAFLACLNSIRFGSPFESGYGQEASQFIFAQVWWTIPNLICSLDKGLFLYCPALALGLFGWVSLIRKHPLPGALCSAIVAINLLLAAAWHSWVGGWSWGPRLLVPTIPFWLIPVAFWLENKRYSIKIVAIASFVIALSFIFQIPGILVKDQQIHHIKQISLRSADRKHTYSDYTMAWVLLIHKLHSDEVYHVTEFGVPDNRKVDLSAFQSYQGFNIWTEHLSRNLNRPVIRWLPIMPIFAMAVLLTRLTKIYNQPINLTD